MARGRLFLSILLGAVAIGTLVVVALWIWSEMLITRAYPVAPETASAGAPAMAAEGRRLGKLYGCTGCHGENLQGKVYNPNPRLVRNYAPNLTLAAARYSDEQLAQAIRQGVRPGDGRALWGMPAQTFMHLTPDELSAVLAFVRSHPPAGAPTPPQSAGWRARAAVLAGALDEPRRAARGRSRPAMDLGPDLARGRHIARTVCSECHGSDLAGDDLEGGPDLRVVGAYDAEAFATLMRTGAPISGRHLGIMTLVARDDFKVFTDAEIADLHAYLSARARALDAAD
ncbi:cytochrome c [Phenylobacterium sp.]|uniref:c-type cytochrome n=1 Tax=Phenylobacterium sp. TaxID=1871053 RepID=UPI0028A129AB|nr:cytochrome c [Phenylobacterium sp.]